MTLPLLVRGQADGTRVLRGGAFNNNENNARCAYRNNNQPDERNNNIGFRLVVAHDFPCMPEMPPGYGWAAEALCFRSTLESWRGLSLAGFPLSPRRSDTPLPQGERGRG